MSVRHISTDYQPHKYQQEVHNNLRRFSVLVCHRRFGKTYLSINSLINAAISFTGTEGRFGYVAPFLKQAKQVSWDYLKRFALTIPGTRANESELSIDFPNGSRVRLYGSDNYEAIRGLYFDGIVLDEVSDMRPATWPEVVRPALADRKGWCLFIGTPKGLNLFHDLYQHALKDKTGVWYAGMYRADETDVLDAEELEMARGTMTDNQYRQEFLCDFNAAVENALITIDRVSQATKKVQTPGDIEGAAKILGVDVARFGDDRSVIQRREGLVAYEPIVYQDIDNMDLAARVAQHINNWKPDAVFIDAGRGEGVIDRLRQLGYRVTEVNFGGKPCNAHYANKRSEMWDELRQWIEDGGDLPNHTELKMDLCAPTYKFDASNRLVLEPKDAIKKRGMRSPDLGDALALTFAFPVAPKPLRGGCQPQHVVHSEYDPFAA